MEYEYLAYCDDFRKKTIARKICMSHPVVKAV